jgi:DNA polymerase
MSPLDGGHAYVQSAAGRRRAKPVVCLSLDYETYSEAELVGPRSVGVWEYSTHPSTEALMVAYRLGGKANPVKHVDLTSDLFPNELEDALLDPTVEKWAFNAAFERVITKNVLHIPTPYEGWRCTMALANMQSFTGDLLQVGVAMGLDGTKLKNKTGQQLIRLFCGPQKVSKNRPLARRTSDTNPFEWEEFCEYNIQDVVAEEEIQEKLIRFDIPEDEWVMYEIDQRINDIGLPVNRKFVEQAQIKSDTRKEELFWEMLDLTQLTNPNSTGKLLPWLQQRGYPFADLQKATVTKVLNLDKLEPMLEAEARQALRIRRFISQTSVKKFPAILRRLSSDDHLRHTLQYGGAARTLRWAGRGPQPHNLTKTPKILEADENGDWSRLTIAADIIENGTYSDLQMYLSEPMIALAGSVRSSFQAHPGYELRVCDLKAIESAVIAWLAGCTRLLDVFANNRDPYRDFGVELYKKRYEDITSAERNICKPAVLGCAYQLGGGRMKDGKRTGLWGYAENMGVNITETEAAQHVRLFRDTYSEIPLLWDHLDYAARSALDKRPVTVNGKLRFELDGPYLTVRLPSGRKMYYYRPRIVTKEFEGKDRITGEPTVFTREVLSYMGKNQFSHQWGRVYSSPGKQAENVTQATAREILAIGIRRAHEVGFNIVGSVHDEIICHQRIDDDYFTVDRLRECMIGEIAWATGLPLDAAGYSHTIYRKD